jgi:hypothetical protein
LGKADPALALAACLWLGALTPGPAPRSHCESGSSAATLCSQLAASDPEQLLFGRRLDLNRAAARSLEVLPGIGPARAAAIVAERCRERFASVRDVERVSGIGPALRAGLASRVEVSAGGAAACDEAPATATAPARDARRSPASSIP